MAPQQFQIGQWLYVLDEVAQMARASNIGDDGSERFYRMESGKYGEPLFFDEPSKRIRIGLDARFFHFDGKPFTEEAYLTGMICGGKAAGVNHRGSLSNPANDWEISDDTTIVRAPDGTRWYLGALFKKDKHRYPDNGYVGMYATKPQNPIVVLEMENLVQLLFK